ncbi:hypothetical protein HY025_04395, partial [Candidatus Daviesbacteria bacterium]|nr:hypothetical protein [Candidatus Daviesbacteria bacterium]
MKKLSFIGFLVVVIIFLLHNQFSNKNLTNSHKEIESKVTLEEHANTVFTKCEKSIYHPSCFDVEIPKLMDSPTNLSMEESFAVTKIIQDKDT